MSGTSAEVTSLPKPVAPLPPHSSWGAKKTWHLLLALSTFALFSLGFSSLSLPEFPSLSSPLAPTLSSPSAELVLKSPNNRSLPPSAEQCSQEILDVVVRQLPPDDCQKFHGTPYNQRCSHTYATRCPDATWFEEHYAKLHNSTMASNESNGNESNGNERLSSSSWLLPFPFRSKLESESPSLRQSSSSSPQSFVGIFVGCNKGMDAVNTMRMGSGDASFDVAAWKDAMTEGGKIKLHNAVCNADDASKQFHLANATIVTATPDSSASFIPPRHRLYCIEPMPSTARALKRSASQLGWDAKGFVVAHAAIAKTDGDAVPFPDSGIVGVENQGMGNCAKRGVGCVNVTVYSLDTFVDKFLDNDSENESENQNDSENQQPQTRIIDYLSVDVEGYDFDVLLGAQKTTLPRVRYLEFEYNWMGSWGHQNLKDAITMLDELGFTCYWPGFDGRIWRITKCWLDHYGIRFWSNVACVNRNLTTIVRDDGGREDAWDVAERMEEMFRETVARGEEVVMDFENRFQHRHRGRR